MDGQYHINFFTLIVEPLHKVIHSWAGPLKARTIFQVVTTMSTPTLILQKEKQRTWCRPALSINQNTHSNSCVYFAILFVLKMQKKHVLFGFFQVSSEFFLHSSHPKKSCAIFYFFCFAIFVCTQVRKKDQ
jgi:hypothetical protein